jgi:hypothetical protein
MHHLLFFYVAMVCLSLPPRCRSTVISSYSNGTIDDLVLRIVLSIEAKMDAMASRLETKMDALGSRLETKMDALGSRLETKMDTMASRLDSKLDDIHKDLFLQHEIEALRANYLESLSTSEHCFDDATGKMLDFSTVHAAYYEGRVFELGVKNSQCNNKREVMYILCDGIDVNILAHCPRADGGVAVNISNYAKLRTGDHTYAYGFIAEKGHISSRYSTGHVSGRIEHDLFPLAPKGEYVIHTAGQLKDMSGSGVINGCGYTGMAHANWNEDNSEHVMALVIPAERILECVSRNLNMLPYLVSCGNISVQDPPKRRFDCPYEQV